MATRRISVVISANTGQYTAGLKQAAAAARKFNQSVSTTSTTTRSASQSTQQLAGSMHQVARGGSAALNLFGRYGAAVRAGQMASQRAGVSTGFLGKSIASMSAIAKEAVFALAGFTGVHAVISVTRNLFSFATKSVVDFDKAMTESLAILPKASEATRKVLEAQAIAVSSQTKFNPAEVAEGYYFLISSGMSAEQSLKAVGEVALFAQAGVLELEKATELAVDVQTAFGLRSDDAAQNLAGLTRVMNVMTQAAIDSNATIEQIAEAFTNKFATGLALGNRTIEEGAAILEVYAARGIKGRAAGTQAYMFLRDIQRAAIENADAVKAYGIEVFDSSGRLNNLVDIQKNLNTAFSKMPAKQMRMALKELGLPDRSVAAILPLIATAPEEVEKYFDGVSKASGAYADVAARQMESIANSIQNLKNKAAGVFIDLGESGLNEFFKIVDALKKPVTDLVTQVVRFGEEVALPALKPVAALLGGTFIGTIKLLATVLGGLVNLLNKVGPVLQPLIVLFALLKTGQFLIKGFGGAILGAAEAFKVMAAMTQQAATSNAFLGSVQMAAAGQQTSMLRAFTGGMQGAVTAGLNGTDRLKAGFSAVTQSAAGAGIAGSVAMSGLTAGITLGVTAITTFYMMLEQTKASIRGIAQERIGEIGEGFDTTTIAGIDQYNAALQDYVQISSGIFGMQKEQGGLGGFLAGAADFFGLGNENVQEEVQRSIDANNKAKNNIEQNVIELSKTTGMSADEIKANAEKMGMDLTLDKESQKAQQTRDEFIARYDDIGSAALNMGLTMEEAMGMSEDAQDEMLENAKKLRDGVVQAFASMIDPKQIVSDINEVNEAIAGASGASFSSVFSDLNQKLKDDASKSAEAQAEAYNKTIEEKITSLEEAKDKVKNTKSKVGKQRIEDLDKEIEALNDAKKSKDDFMSGKDPVASLNDFFSSLAGKADESKLLTDSLLTIKERLSVLGISPDFADKIIQQLSSLGPEGLPIIQQFAQAGVKEFTDLAIKAQDSISKLNPEIAPTWKEVQNRISQSKTRVDELGTSLVGVAGYLAGQGITAEQLQQFVGLGPEYASMIITMAGEMGTVSAEEMAEGIRSILAAADFSEGKIPDAIMSAMNWAILVATGKTGELIAGINQGIIKGAPEIIKTLEDSGLLGILSAFGMLGFTPTGSAAAGVGAPPPPGAAPPPPPPPGPKVTAGSAKKDSPVGLKMAVDSLLNGDYGYVTPDVRQYLQALALNSKTLYAQRETVMRILKNYGVSGYADGGFEKHNAMIAKGGIRIWNEPETGGEAYIPLAASKRARSERILGQVAKEFGYGLTKFAEGGFYGTAGSRMVGGGNFGTQAQNTQTIVVPVQSKNETNFNGPIVGVNMDDAVRFAERKKRQRALTR